MEDRGSRVFCHDLLATVIDILLVLQKRGTEGEAGSIVTNETETDVVKVATQMNKVINIKSSIHINGENALDLYRQRQQ